MNLQSIEMNLFVISRTLNSRRYLDLDRKWGAWYFQTKVLLYGNEVDVRAAR